MKILAYTSPARGHLYPLVPILDELAGRGHRIVVRTLASAVSLMSDRGFDAAPIAPAIEAIAHDDYLARTPPAKLKRGMATSASGLRTRSQISERRSPPTSTRAKAYVPHGGLPPDAMRLAPSNEIPSGSDIAACAPERSAR